MDDGQKTPRGHHDFNSYVKILRGFIFQMNGQTEKLIRCGLGNLISSSPTISTIPGTIDWYDSCPSSVIVQ